MAVKYKEVARILEKQIVNNEYAETMKLPTEDELIETFKVSRNTVRHAIETLVKLGLVVPIQGSGVFIREKPQDGSISLEAFQGLTDGFKKADIKTEVVAFELIEADEEIAKHLNVELGDPVYYIERVRHLNNRPYVFEVSYYNKKVIVYLSREIIEGSIYRYIREDLNHQMGYVYRVISAEKLTSKHAKYLGLKAGEPTLVTTNTAMLKSGVVFDYSIDYHHFENASFLKLANFI